MCIILIIFIFKNFYTHYLFSKRFKYPVVYIKIQTKHYGYNAQFENCKWTFIAMRKQKVHLNISSNNIPEKHKETSKELPATSEIKHQSAN